MTTSKIHLRYLKRSNLISVSGNSTGLQLLPTYTKLINQVKDHFDSSEKLNCYFKYNLINASTAKLLFNLFNYLDTQSKRGNCIKIFWLIEKDNDDLKEIGLDFKNSYNLNFNICEDCKICPKGHCMFK